MDRGEFLLCERQHWFSADGRRRVRRVTIAHSESETENSVTPSNDTHLPSCVPALSSAVVSWVCGWMPSCTEAPPPSALPSTTNHSPPSRTSASTVLRCGPSSSFTLLYTSYFNIHALLHDPRSCKVPPKSITHHLEANLATPQWHWMLCERGQRAAPGNGAEMDPEVGWPVYVGVSFPLKCVKTLLLSVHWLP